MVFRYQFRIDENDGKFSEREENAVGKGEIAKYEQFLFLPQSFQKICTSHINTRACVGKG